VAFAAAGIPPDASDAAGAAQCFAGGAGKAAGAVGDTAKAVGKTPSKTPWNLGGHKSAQKWQNQMKKRGWTPQQIDDAISSGQKFPAPNNINPANGATRYVNPTTGQSVVVDNVTGEVLHVGGPGFRY
jgi:hypothetical protein